MFRKYSWIGRSKIAQERKEIIGNIIPPRPLLKNIYETICIYLVGKTSGKAVQLFKAQYHSWFQLDLCGERLQRVWDHPPQLWADPLLHVEERKLLRRSPAGGRSRVRHKMLINSLSSLAYLTGSSIHLASWVLSWETFSATKSLSNVTLKQEYTNHCWDLPPRCTKAPVQRNELSSPTRRSPSSALHGGVCSSGKRDNKSVAWRS